MTEPFNTFVARGGGKLAFRLSIAGFQYEAVTARGMEGEQGDGRIRQLGLSLAGTKITQKADPVTAKIEAGGATFEFVDLGQVWTNAFMRRETSQTWFNGASISDSDSTMEVLSTADWPSEGVLHINQEAISYSILDSTHFSLETRGFWGSQARYHYSQTGSDIRYPKVTDTVSILEGRRVFLYAYAAGDDPTGNGTLVWQGIISGEPRMTGPKWSILCDSIVSLLDSELGADIEEPVNARGIYYPGPTDGPAADPSVYYGRCAWVLWESIDDTIPLGSESTTNRALIQLAGFWESTTEFVAAINAEIAAQTVGWDSASIVCVEEPSGGYHFEFTTDGTPKGVSIKNFHSPDIEDLEAKFSFREDVYDDTGNVVSTVSGNTTYFIKASGQPKPLPRGVYGRGTTDTFPPQRIYLGGIFEITAEIQSVSLEFSDVNTVVGFGGGGGTISTESPSIVGTVTDFNSTERWILVAPTPTTGMSYFSYSGFDGLSIKVSRTYNLNYGGDVYGTWGLLRALTDLKPAQVNKGSQPAILETDWAGSDTTGDTSWFDFYASAPNYLSSRFYTTSKPISLMDLITPDLQIACHFLSLTSTGALNIKPLRFASQTEVSVFQITKQNIIGFPTFEVMPAGNFSSMIIKDGYDAREEKWKYSPLMPQDVTSLGRRGGRRSIEVSLRSSNLDASSKITIDNAVAIADQTIGIYGHPYAYITCTIPLTSWLSTAIGDPISITTHLLPSIFGSRGVTNLPGIILAREISPYESIIQVTFLVSLSPIFGYGAEARVESLTPSTGTNITFTLDSSYFKAGEVASNHFKADDRVTVYEWNKKNPTTYLGVVQSASGNAVVVTLDSSFTEGSSSWVLKFASSDEPDCTENQRLYCYLAESNGIINFDPNPDLPAATLSSGE